jgi:hypothetical protein
LTAEAYPLFNCLKINDMKNKFFIFIALCCLSEIHAQAFLGQFVPDITETDCNNNRERIYDVLAAGKPILIFKTDMATCGNTTAWGTTVRQFANLYAAEYRTWVCADFLEANNPTDQCSFMTTYEQATGLSDNNSFRFIDTISSGPYDPSSRGVFDIQCYQGYIVIGLDSTIVYLGNDLNTAVNAALSAGSTNTHTHNDAQNDFSIFPNPSSGLINLVTDLQLEKVVFYNAAGQIAFVYKGTEQQKINISAIESGVYFAHFTFDNGKTAIKKIIKTGA